MNQSGSQSESGFYSKTGCLGESVMLLSLVCSLLTGVDLYVNSFFFLALDPGGDSPSSFTKLQNSGGMNFRAKFEL